jgi:hypothetical protein
MRTKFGGLNTVSGELALPKDDSPSLLNVDFDIGGSVRKRNGTLTLFQDEVTPNPVFVSSYVTLAGYEFIISKFNTKLRVLDLQNDVVTKLWERDNVFKSANSLPFSIPLDDNFNLLVCEKQAPIQVRFEEVSAVATVDGSIVITVGDSWVNTFTDCVVYVDNVRVARTVGYAAGDITVTSASIAIGAVVYVCTFSWQWWAESLIWFGDNFYQRQSRFGVSNEDIHVQVPNSIVTDEIPDSERYGVFAYINDAFDNPYTYKSDNQPEISLEYSFSDGSNYTPSPETFTSPSKFFITFGDISNSNIRTFTDKNVSGNQITILKHKLKDFDIINVSNTEGDLPVNLLDSSSYFVKEINEDVIELYSDALLASIVTIGARNTKNFTDLALDYTDNFVAITAHGFVDTQPIRFTSTNTLPIGINETTTYYVKTVSVNAFEIYFDQNLRKRVIFVYRTELFFDNTVAAGDILNIPQHNLFTGDAVRVKTNNGTLPATLNATSVYYVLVLTANAIKLYSDSALTTVVPNYHGPGVGDIFLYLDGGVHSVIADGLETTLERVAYDSVSFLRLRQLRFNNKKGVLNANLDVYVGDTEITRSTILTVAPSLQYYTHETESLTPYTGTTTLQQFVSFTASTPIGVRKDEYVTLINTETKWCGTAALNTMYNFDNGSYVPAYGLGDYANYDEGLFPTFGALYQSRLCLAGVGASLLVSGVYDRIIEDAPYRYFQVTDDLSNPVLDPFLIRVPFSQSDTVLAMKQWQQFLFVFTRTSTYKTSLDQNSQFSSSTPTLNLTANVGCIGRDGVETTESTMFFLSENGVFDLGIVAQNEYRASEISLPIRNIVKDFGADSKIVYDTFNNKLYVYNERLMVYFTDQKVWSEYQAVLPWDISSFLFWREFVLLCCKNLCDFQLTRTEYEKYIDFAKEFTSGEVYVQPCSTSIPSYVGVNVYESPIVMTPILEEQDVHVLQNGTRIVYGEDWYKLSDNQIYVNNPVDGLLRFFYRLRDTFNGAVVFKDEEAFPLNNVSLGLVLPNNICTYAPYNGNVVGDGTTAGGGVDGAGLGGGTDSTGFSKDIGLPTIFLGRSAESIASDLRAFISISTTYTDASTYSVAFSDTTGYTSFVATGVSSAIEEASFTDGITSAAVTTSASDKNIPEGAFRLDASLVSAGITDNATTCVILIEVWSKTPTIPLNRLALFVGVDPNGTFANTADASQSFTLGDGNPGNRTITGTLQPNGLYKGLTNIGLSFPLGVGNLIYSASSMYIPETVDTYPNIVYVGGILVP